MFQLYPVLSPPNSNKDAKYSIVRGDDGDWEVRLIYRDSNGEHLRTNNRHKKLIAKVNEIKEQQSQGRPGGIFYINEFRHVLVPHTGEGYIYAGTHRKLLDFDFFGRTLSPAAPSSLAPGATTSTASSEPSNTALARSSSRPRWDRRRPGDSPTG